MINDKRDERLVIAFIFSRYLYFLVVLSIKDTNHNGLVMNLEEDNRFIRVWLLYMSLCEKREVRSYRSSRPLWGQFFLSRLPTVACWSREKSEEGV